MDVLTELLVSISPPRLLAIGGIITKRNIKNFAAAKLCYLCYVTCYFLLSICFVHVYELLIYLLATKCCQTKIRTFNTCPGPCLHVCAIYLFKWWISSKNYCLHCRPNIVNNVLSVLSFISVVGWRKLQGMVSESVFCITQTVKRAGYNFSLCRITFYANIFSYEVSIIIFYRMK